MNAHPGTDLRLPFGKHKGKHLADVPAGYLSWLLRSCKLSSGLRAAVAGELARRGIDAPSIPTLIAKLPRCRCCTSDCARIGWQQDRAGRRRIRAECSCGRFLTFLPIVEPWIAAADANASPTPILDALTQLDDLDIDLASDGKAVWLTGDDWRRVPPDLYATIRQCSNQLEDAGENPLRVTRPPVEPWSIDP